MTDFKNNSPRFTDNGEDDISRSRMTSVGEQMEFVNEITSMFDTSLESADGSPKYSKPFGSAHSRKNDESEHNDEHGEDEAIPQTDDSETVSEEKKEEPKYTLEDIAKMIKKGNDDPFNANVGDYESDKELESLVKTGSDDPFNTDKRKENEALTQTDGSEETVSEEEPEYTLEDIAKMIKKGNDDPFNAKADDYESDKELEALVKTGSDNSFNTAADSYESDAALEALIRKGAEGIALSQTADTPKEENDPMEE